MHSFVRLIVWISGSNNLGGQIPSELGLLTNLEYVNLGKSFLSFYLDHLSYEYTLICVYDFFYYSG
jgi:Leucine-rich repeat (LRR) protein